MCYVISFYTLYVRNTRPHFRRSISRYKNAPNFAINLFGLYQSYIGKKTLNQKLRQIAIRIKYFWVFKRFQSRTVFTVLVNFYNALLQTSFYNNVIKDTMAHPTLRTIEKSFKNKISWKFFIFILFIVFSFINGIKINKNLDI